MGLDKNSPAATTCRDASSQCQARLLAGTVDSQIVTIQTSSNGALTARSTVAEEEEQAAEEAISQDEVTTRLQEPSYFGALQLLCDEAGFLVDSKAHKMLASLPKHQDEQLIHAESVVKALGVTDGASFDALMAALSVGEPEGTGSQSIGDPTLIHPADAVSRLRDFVEAENGGAAAAPTIGLAGELFYIVKRLSIQRHHPYTETLNFRRLLKFAAHPSVAKHVQVTCSLLSRPWSDIVSQAIAHHHQIADDNTARQIPALALLSGIGELDMQASRCPNLWVPTLA